MRIVFILATVLISLQAQEVTLQNGGPPSIRVHGEATISAQPDQAQLDIGVVTQASTVTAAVDQNAAQTNKIMQELKSLAKNNDIKTINFSVNPNYKYAKEGGTPSIDGYTANNTVRLVLHDLSQVPTAIEATTKSGANTLNGLSYSLKDEKAVRVQALSAAAKQAKADAEALASALQITMGRLLRVEEGQSTQAIPLRGAYMSAKAEMTPVSPGSIDVRADVYLSYEIIGDSSAPVRNR